MGGQENSVQCLKATATRTAARAQCVEVLRLIGLVTWGRRQKAHDEKDAAPDGEYPEYLIGEIVDHDAIQSKPLVRFKTRETIFRDPYRLAQRWPSHEGVLYRRAGYVTLLRSRG